MGRVQQFTPGLISDRTLRRKSQQTSQDYPKASEGSPAILCAGLVQEEIIKGKGGAELMRHAARRRDSDRPSKREVSQSI